jgi:hypothetical protein
MLKKLFYLVSVFMVVGLISPVAAQDMEISVGTPVIDGQVDDIWADAAEASFVPLEDPADGSGIWKALYDAENLYVLVDVTDDSLQNDSADSWLDDSVEIYFDGGNTKLNTPLAGDDHQYTFGWTADDIQGNNITGYTDGIEQAQVDTDTGWRIEVKMPWMSIWGVVPQAGDLIGIDVYYNDDDDGGDSREGKMLSFSAVEGWNDASQWATAVLAAEPEPEPTGPKVIWVSFHGADDAPSAGAAGAGFTEAPDKAYTDLLTANGYDVTRYITTSTPDPAVLNAADLVIISRSVASGGYQNDGATAWNNISAPMIIMGGYVLRNSRMGYTTGGTMPDTTGDIMLTVSDPTHPIFAGIPLTDGTMDNPFAGVVVYPTDGTTVARGISINTDPVNAEGTVLATISEAGNGPVGGMVIGEWPAGAVLTHSGGAGTDVLAGHRLVFLSGSREADGVNSETAGMYDLYEDGAKMFLNAVKYMIPVVPVNPGTDGLVAYYALENDANDSSGNGLNGTIVGDPNFVEGAVGMGLQLDGVDDYVDLGNDPLFDLTEQVTLSLWVNTQDIGSTQNNPWLGKGDTSYMIKGHREGNQIEFFIYDGGWVTAHADVGAEFNGEWHHAAGVFDGEKLIIYVDGEEAVSVDYEGVGIVPNTYNVAIGTNTQAGGRFSESIIDEAMIYSRALSAGEIRYLAGERAPFVYDGDVLDDSWDHDNSSDAWDGTGPGEGSPGGFGLLSEDDVTFLRVQDTGDPRDYGMPDPSNRKIYLTQQIDYGLDGTRLEFQLRVATTPPLDDMHPDGGAGVAPWPEGGMGYHIRDGGKGMVGIAEDGVGQISFSLAKAGEIAGLETDALVVNGLLGTEMSGDVDTGDAATPNYIAIDDATAWNNVTVDIAAGGAGTHVLTISINGGDAVTIEVTAGDAMDGENNYVAIGSSGTGAVTAFDVDYIKVSN